MHVLCVQAHLPWRVCGALDRAPTWAVLQGTRPGDALKVVGPVDPAERRWETESKCNAGRRPKDFELHFEVPLSASARTGKMAQRGQRPVSWTGSG